ncbi:MAG: class I SAM-dependent methyltransferase [Flavobacteriales bacterium]|nr:class I SAM-dependent methyltransferase [Flavobacteriales bacterium]
MTTINNQAKFYDDYVDRQLKMGVNHRHLSIIDKLVLHGLKSEDDVLEIGCGIGTVSKLIASVVKIGKIHINDLSVESIKVAKELLKASQNVSFSSGNILDQEIEMRFDWIVLPDVLEHIPLELHADLFQKMEMYLKPNGKIFIHIPQPDYLNWVIENQPHLLQEIDQPVYLSELLPKIEKVNLMVSKLEDYSIYIKPYDYRYILVKRREKSEFKSAATKSHGIIDKIRYKMRYGKL